LSGLAGIRNSGARSPRASGASKDIIIYTDSDLPISLLDIKNSLPLIERADIVTAVSKIRKGDTLKRKIISIGYNTLLRVLFNMNIRDVNSGYKVFRKKIIEGMDFLSESPFIDAEIFLRARKRGGTILEYPLIFRPRKQGVSKVARMSVLFRTFYDMVKYRMAH
jgi:dolichol-phosphate mannosyltransferase